MSKISVCMPTYNGERYIRQQIESILSQLGDNDELIISDDHSTDSTIQIINNFEDKRIKLLTHNKKPHRFTYAYTSDNLTNALNVASGDIIFLADQDDVWLDDKVLKMTSALESADAVLSDCSIVDEKLNILVSSKISNENVRISDFWNIYTCGYLGCCIAFKSHLLSRILPIPKNVPHDLWIGLVCNNYGHFKILHDVTLLYRRHTGNVSMPNKSLKNRKNSIKTNSFFHKIHYRLYIFKAYITLILNKHLR